MCISVGKDVKSVALDVFLDASANSLSGGVALCRGGIGGAFMRSGAGYHAWFNASTSESVGAVYFPVETTVGF